MAQFQSGASNGYVLKLNVNEVSTNVTNNTSVVAWSVECSCGGAYAQWNPGPGIVSVTIDGVNLYNNRPAFVFPGYNSTILYALDLLRLHITQTEQNHWDVPHRIQRHHQDIIFQVI